MWLVKCGASLKFVNTLPGNGVQYAYSSLPFSFFLRNRCPFTTHQTFSNKKMNKRDCNNQQYGPDDHSIIMTSSQPKAPLHNQARICEEIKRPNNSRYDHCD